MTRETKVGAVVAISFLSLVGVVVVSKWRKPADDAASAAVTSPEQAVADGKRQHSEKGAGHESRPGPIAPATFNTTNANDLPTNLPPAAASDPLLPPAPMAVGETPLIIPGSPGGAEDEKRAKLQSQIAQDSQGDVIPLPPGLPEAAAKINEGAAKIESLIPGLNDKKPLNPDFDFLRERQKTAQEEGAAKIEATFAQGLEKLEEGANKINDGAGKKVDKLNDTLGGGLQTGAKTTKEMQKGHNDTAKDLGNLSVPMLPPPPNLPNTDNPPLPAPPVVDAGPMKIGDSSEKPAKTLLEPAPAFPNVPAPAPTPMTPLNPSAAPLIATPLIATPRPLLPAPETKLADKMPGAPNPGNMPPIPAPAKDVRDVDVQTFTARGGETLDNISKAAYNSEKYAKALLAYNRDFSPNRGTLSMTLQAGQKLFVPPAQLLQERYAAVIDEPTPIPISINPPVPANAAPGNTATANPPMPIPRPATTSDQTKLYRVPAQGQLIYEIALRTLGDGNRWTEIYRLNPNVDPRQPIAGGTELRLPGNARVP